MKTIRKNRLIITIYCLNVGFASFGWPYPIYSATGLSDDMCTEPQAVLTWVLSERLATPLYTMQLIPCYHSV